MRSCRGYTALEAFRKSPVARLVYFGQRVKEYGPLTIVGTITRAIVDETDGDCTFDVSTDVGEAWHCEITPCAHTAVREYARALQAGDRVRVSGTKRWDPPHILGGFSGHWEIHPVAHVERL